MPSYVDGQNAVDAFNEALDTGTNPDLQVFIDRPFHVAGATIQCPPETRIYADHFQRGHGTRSGDYGDTFRCGTDAVAAGAFQVENIWLRQLRDDPSGDAIDDRVTQGAHFKVKGGQNGHIKGCLLWDMKYGLDAYGTTSWGMIGNKVRQFNDPTKPGWQEGRAAVRTQFHATHKGCKDWCVEGGIYGGATSPVRDVTYDLGGAEPVVVQHSVNIGGTHGFLLHSMEGIGFGNLYLGGQSERSVSLIPYDTVSNVRFNGTNFDPSAKHNIFVSRGDADHWVEDLIINGVTAKGQMNGLGLLEIAEAFGQPSLYGGSVVASSMKSHLAAPLRVAGWRGFVMNALTISNYNCRNIAPHDYQWSAGIALTGQASAYVVTDILPGGGGNQYDNNPEHNFTKAGVYRADPNAGIVNRIMCAPLGIPGGGAVV